jgi:hypothetical protein
MRTRTASQLFQSTPLRFKPAREISIIGYNNFYDTDTIPPTYQAWLYQKVFCECCGMQLRTTPMISAYKRILKERLYTVGEKAAGRNNTPGSGS